MNNFRLYNPDAIPTISGLSTISEFFEEWFVPERNGNRRRRPIADATIKRYRERVAWWPKLMGSLDRPGGPLIGEITDDLLAEFAVRLESATYSRGVKVIRLSPASQFGILNDIMTILAAAGPKQGRRLRAALIADPPSLYVERPAQWPKDHWTLDEVRQLVNAINCVPPPLRWSQSVDAFRQLLRASIAVLFYTGERAGTVYTLRKESLVSEVSGRTWLFIPKTVKTHRPRRIAVHRQLRAQLLRLVELISGAGLIPWPTQTWVDYHQRLQAHAGLPGERQFTLQAWRRLHGSIIEQMGFAIAEGLAQESLGHSSAAVTRASYTATIDAAILRMPDIF